MSAKKVSTLQSNALTGNGTEVTPLNGSHDHTVYVMWGAGTSAGGVTVETGPYKGYTGTWIPQTVFAWSAASRVDEWRGTGPFGAVRARISTTVVTSDQGVSAELQEN